MVLRGRSPSWRNLVNFIAIAFVALVSKALQATIYGKRSPYVRKIIKLCNLMKIRHL